jgi:hypothetical protein
MMLVACGGTWKIQKRATYPQNEISIDKIAIIERQEDRRSPKIKTFKHVESGISKESAGSRHNDAYAVNRVETPPGNVEIGVVFPWNHRIYYPEVKFKAAPGRKYSLTWICIPYPFVAIIDAATSNIVALDSYCPDCKGLIGATLLPSTECLRYLQPPWMEPDEKSKWLPWLFEYTTQMYRNLCYAADHGLTSARMRLGLLYSLGIYGATEDPVLAYVWYRLAADSGDEQAIKYAESLKENRLSAIQLEKAQHMLSNWQIGQCEEQFLGSSKQKYKLQIDN